MHLCNNRVFAHSRRDMLRMMSCGFGLMAFAGIANGASAAQRLGLAPPADDTPGNPLAARAGHFAPRAKRVIFLCMAGGPSHVDTWDYKPQLAANDGKALSGYRAGARLLASPWKFKQYGKSGLWVSDLLPETAKLADDLCLLHGMNTAVPAHPQATVMMHTGSFQFVRPSMGAWTLYGLGTENQNLPGYITLNPPSGQGGAQNYGAGFLPAVYQGTRVGVDRNGRRQGAGADGGMPNLKNDTLTSKAQREQLELVQKLNKERAKRDSSDDAVEGVIGSYELAFRMQAEMPQLMDISQETQKTKDMYGIGKGNDSFARQCLLARRFAEKGVRFIEVNHGGWDTHRNLRDDLEKQCGEIDRPIAALLADLKQRGLLKDTLVVWGGEFGRTPYAQNGDGRDHNHKGFTMWMAGGGVKGGLSYGSTDENGIEAVDGKMDIHDWHATMLHLLGINHEQLTYQYAGRDFRLTEVYGHVHKEILA